MGFHRLFLLYICLGLRFYSVTGDDDEEEDDDGAPKNPAHERDYKKLQGVMAKSKGSGMEMFTSVEQMENRKREIEVERRDQFKKNGTTPVKSLSKEEQVKEGSWQLEPEFVRYVRTTRFPSTTDRSMAQQMGLDIRCEACEIILRSLLTKAKSHSEDHIMDAIEAELKEAPPRPPKESSDMSDLQAHKVARNRFGCNKHFKDELLLKGKTVMTCKDMNKPPPGSEDREFCISKVKIALTEEEANIYEPKHEAMYLACKHTLAMYGSEMAASLEEKLHGRKNADIKEAVAKTCKKEGKCTKKRAAKKKVDDDDEL